MRLFCIFWLVVVSDLILINFDKLRVLVIAGIYYFLKLVSEKTDFLDFIVTNI